MAELSFQRILTTLDTCEAIPEFTARIKYYLNTNNISDFVIIDDAHHTKKDRVSLMSRIDKWTRSRLVFPRIQEKNKPELFLKRTCKIFDIDLFFSTNSKYCNILKNIKYGAYHLNPATYTNKYMDDIVVPVTPVIYNPHNTFTIVG